MDSKNEERSEVLSEVQELSVGSGSTNNAWEKCKSRLTAIRKKRDDQLYEALLAEIDGYDNR